MKQIHKFEKNLKILILTYGVEGALNVNVNISNNSDELRSGVNCHFIFKNDFFAVLRNRGTATIKSRFDFVRIIFCVLRALTIFIAC